jgi:hypothetical protein
MRFAEGHLRDLTAIATMRKVVLADGRVVRRVVSVDEIRPVGGDKHEILNIFKYDHGLDSFQPTTPAEVVDRSFRLNEIANEFGWTSARVQKSLSGRAAFLAKKIADGGFSPEDLSRMVRDYSAQELEGEGRST